MSEQTTDPDTRTEDEKTADIAVASLVEIAGDSIYPSADRVAAATQLLEHYRYFYG